MNPTWDLSSLYVLPVPVWVLPKVLVVLDGCLVV